MWGCSICNTQLLYCTALSCSLVCMCCAGDIKPEPLKVDVNVSSGQPGAEPEQARRPRRVLAPGSFLRHLLSSKHSASKQPFSDLEITAQAFIFLLAGAPF